MMLTRQVRLAIGDHVFLRRLLALAAPIAFQNFLVTALNMIDTFMVGRLGETSIAAVALGNQLYFLLVLTLFGIGSGAAIFAAQYWGNRDVRGVRHTYALALTIGLIASTAFALTARFAGTTIMGLYSRDPLVVEKAANYIGIVGLSYPATAVNFITYAMLRSVGRARMPLVGTITALTVNILGNYALIFGHWGFPALGVTGAAIATFLARLFELMVIVTIVLHRRAPIVAPFRELFGFDLAFVRRFARRAVTVILNEMGWSLGITMYSVIFARMGTAALAAQSISDTVTRLTFVAFIGTGHATAVLVGNAIGAGRVGTARRYTSRLLVMLPLAGVLAGMVVLTIAPFVPRAFNVSPDVARHVHSILRVWAVIVVVKILNMNIIVGILRSGGDTTYGALLELTSLWCVGVPLAAFLGLILEVPPYVVYVAIGIEELTKLSGGLLRVRSGRWIHRVTV